MASTKWYILMEPAMMNMFLLNTTQTIQEKFELVSLDTFMENPSKYKTNIDAICGFYGAPLLMHHIKRKGFLESFPNLRVLFSCGAGTDHLLFPALWNGEIRVATTGKDFNCTETAELGFLLMMASARKFNQALEILKVGSNSQQIHNFRLQESVSLKGLKLGIVGMGDIGYKVAERAAAFEMNILYYNRNQRSKDEEEKVKAKYCYSLAKLLSQSDFVMLCVPLTKDTKHMIGAEEFKLMKSSATLINIGRGDVVDTDALVVALEQKDIQGATLDVTSPEPLPPDHPLLHMSNVIVTPHYGGYTQQSCKTGNQIMIASLLAGLEGRPMKYELRVPEDNINNNS